jgi:creatinine amidohydrolase
MHGPYIPGLSAIAGANPAAYRWRYISSRSPNGVIGDASKATPEKGEKLLSAIAQAFADALMVKEFWSTPV